MTTPTFAWPVDGYYAVSSGFTDTRNYGLHAAIDIPAPIGAPVTPVAPGYVGYAGPFGSCGLSVQIAHAGGWRSHYCHLNFIRTRRGNVVSGFTPIGDVGATGAALGPHLHLNLFSPAQPAGGDSLYVGWVGKWAVDPLDYLQKKERDDMVIILYHSAAPTRWVLVNGVRKTYLTLAAYQALKAAGPDLYREVKRTKAEIDAIPNYPWYR